jgi:hypothetical protein
MRSEEFASNPIGTDFDPQALLERYRSGASNEELLHRPMGPASQIPATHGVT